MNKPSERIVVFVTPAQKRAISATADGLGISVSELMRRAVIAFSATEEQVKAASIVDRLNAPRQPDALAQVLRKAAARPLRERTGSPLPGAAARPPARGKEQTVAEPVGVDEPEAAVAAEAAREPALMTDGSSAHATIARVLQADVEPLGESGDGRDASQAQAAALPSLSMRARGLGNAAREIAQAVARLTGHGAATEAALAAADAADAHADASFASPGALTFARADRPYAGADTADDCHDEAPEGGKFA